MAERVYVGTFNQTDDDPKGREEGIFWFQFDPQTGKLTREGAARAVNPAFMTLSADGRFLYAVNEVGQFKGEPGGGVSAFAVEPHSGQLTFVNSQHSFGESPCYLSLDRTGKWVLVANYFGGSVAVYPVAADGSLGSKSDFIQHHGHGSNPERQEKAHAHSIQMDPTNRLALVADLGLDQVKVYRLDLNQGKLLPHEPGLISLPSGAGPRHLDFHPNRRWMYIIDELDATLAFFDYNVTVGSFTHQQTVSIVPEGTSAEKWAADIHVHPSGRFVYASNRGDDSLAAFAIDPVDGKVTLSGVVNSGGGLPRNFGIDPGGRWLIAANQKGNNLVVFAIDAANGSLTATGETALVMAPVCVKFMMNSTPLQ